MSAPSLLSVQSDSAATVLTSSLRPLWLRGQYVFDEPLHSFYEIAGQDVLVMECLGGVWVASHSNASLRHLRADVGYVQINHAG